MSLARYSRRHDFQYPEYRGVVRRKTRNMNPRRRARFRSYARGEDTAGQLYKAVRSKHAGIRRRRLRRLRRHAQVHSASDRESYNS